MANTLTLNATRANTTKIIEFYNPATQQWVDGTSVGTDAYRVVFAGIPAGTYGAGTSTPLQCRLKGSSPPIVGTFTDTVTVVGGSTNPVARLYLILGQSNALGVPNVSFLSSDSTLAAFQPALASPFSDFLTYNVGTGNFDPLDAPDNNSGSTPGSTFGSELGLAARHTVVYPNNPGYMVKLGSNGTPIASFQKGSNAGIYELFRQRVTAAKAKLVSLGYEVQIFFFWNQWESDPGSTTYAADFQKMVNDYVADGVLTTTTRIAIATAWSDNVVYQQQQQIAATAPNRIKLVDTSGYTKLSDNLHYDARAQVLCGNVDLWNAFYDTALTYPFPMTAGGGTTPTTPAAPTVANFNESTRKLTYSHALGVGELEYYAGSTATYVAYPSGGIQVDDNQHDAGYIQCRTRAATNRNPSAPTGSPAIAAKATQVTTGYEQDDNRADGSPVFEYDTLDNWPQASGIAGHGSYVRYSQVNGATINIKFGRRITYWFQNDGRFKANFQISIDGGMPTQISVSASDSSPVVQFDSGLLPALANGAKHTLTVTNGSFGYADYVEITE